MENTIMSLAIITETPVSCLNEYQILRDGNLYIIVHKINGDIVRRSRATCAEAFSLYHDLKQARVIGESYRNIAKVGTFDPCQHIKWSMTAWVNEVAK
jgi:hypothetical protein